MPGGDDKESVTSMMSCFAIDWRSRAKMCQVQFARHRHSWRCWRGRKIYLSSIRMQVDTLSTCFLYWSCSKLRLKTANDATIWKIEMEFSPPLRAYRRRLAWSFTWLRYIWITELASFAESSVINPSLLYRYLRQHCTIITSFVFLFNQPLASIMFFKLSS